MDLENSPNAQGQQAEAETPDVEGQSNESAGSPQNDGFQRRIDQLVGSKKQTEEQLAQERAQAQAKESEYLRVIAQLSAQVPQAIRDAEPQVEVDPEERKRIEAVFGPRLKAMESYLAQVEAQTAVQQVRQQAQAQYGDPAIADEAAKLIATWKQKGFTGWTPDDALIYAAGRKAVADQMLKAKSRDARGRFNSTADQPLTGNAAPPAPPSLAYPADFERRPLADQIKIIEKRLEGKSW